jgi:hypothetical protein
MNYSTAAEWFRKSAEKGVVIAQRRLGKILLNGMPKITKEAVTVPKAPDEGFRWLLIAAYQGDGVLKFPSRFGRSKKGTHITARRFAAVPICGWIVADVPRTLPAPSHLIR